MKKAEKVTECGGFGIVLMTFPSISVKIIASAHVHVRVPAVGRRGIDC